MNLPPSEYDAVHKFVQDLASNVLHPKQVDSLSDAIVGAIHADAAPLLAFADEREAFDQTGRSHAREFEVDAAAVMQHVIPTLISGRPRIVVAALGSRPTGTRPSLSR